MSVFSFLHAMANFSLSFHNSNNFCNKQDISATGRVKSSRFQKDLVIKIDLGNKHVLHCLATMQQN